MITLGSMSTVGVIPQGFFQTKSPSRILTLYLTHFDLGFERPADLAVYQQGYLFTNKDV